MLCLNQADSIDSFEDVRIELDTDYQGEPAKVSTISNQFSLGVLWALWITRTSRSCLVLSSASRVAVPRTLNREGRGLAGRRRAAARLAHSNVKPKLSVEAGLLSYALSA